MRQRDREKDKQRQRDGGRAWEKSRETEDRCEEIKPGWRCDTGRLNGQREERPTWAFSVAA